jgi:hypothetical protein
MASPYLLKVRPQEIAICSMIVKVSPIEWSIPYFTDMALIIRNSPRRDPFSVARIVEYLSGTVVTR